jgi:hypothetical protein
VKGGGGILLLSNLNVDVLRVMRFPFVYSGENSVLRNRGVEVKLFCLRG